VTVALTNREIGLVWMADILARLYDTWPGLVTLELQDTVAATGVQPANEEAAHELWFNLGQWLEAEGNSSEVGKASSGKCQSTTPY
jgi:hypothetical protein